MAEDLVRFRPALYRTFRPPVRGFFHAYFGVRVRGEENVPATGPVIVAANHTSYLDSVFLAAFSPRPVRFMMLREFYDMPVIGFLTGVFGSFPVDGTGITKATFRMAEEVLRRREILGIFPEGGRSRTGKLMVAKPGAMLLALREQVPVVPAALGGTFQALPPGVSVPRFRRRLTVTFGEPITAHLSLAYPADKDRVPELTALLMERLGRLLEPLPNPSPTGKG